MYAVNDINESPGNSLCDTLEQARTKCPPSGILQVGGARKSMNTTKTNFSSYFLPTCHTVKHGI